MKKIMKKKRIVTAILITCIGFVGGLLIHWNSYKGLKLINDIISIEAGEELDIHIEDFVKADEDILAHITLDVSRVNTSKTGEYIALLLYEEKEYEIRVVVIDTKAPKVSFQKRCVFTKDMESLVPTEWFATVEEYSDYSASITAYEKEVDLDVMTEEKIQELEATLLESDKQKGLAKKRSKEIPTEEGIFRYTIKLEDEHGNVRYEEVYVIFDRTAPVIEGDLEVTMKTDDFSKAPELDLANYQITDNVDGVLSGSALLSELELVDQEKHIYVNHLSAVDRAGNKCTLDVTIRLEEKKTAVTSNSASSGGTISAVVNTGGTMAHEISGFPVVYQNPELPTGCEVTALTMLLNYYGYPVSKTTMASNYLPQVASGYTGRVDLDYYFCGNPYGVGIGCGAGALVTAANRFLADSGSALCGVDLTGASADTLYGYVSEGMPVVVMVTIGMANRKAVKGWHTTEGKYVTWSDNDHGLVLIGWDANSVKVACPLFGIKTYSRAQFEKIYVGRGCKAMILQ